MVRRGLVGCGGASYGRQGMDMNGQEQKGTADKERP